jgi:hypothetical protein
MDLPDDSNPSVDLLNVCVLDVLDELRPVDAVVVELIDERKSCFLAGLLTE